MSKDAKTYPATTVLQTLAALIVGQKMLKVATPDGEQSTFALVPQPNLFAVEVTVKGEQPKSLKQRLEPIIGTEAYTAFKTAVMGFWKFSPEQFSDSKNHATINTTLNGVGTAENEAVVSGDIYNGSLRFTKSVLAIPSVAEALQQVTGATNLLDGSVYADVIDAAVVLSAPEAPKAEVTTPATSAEEIETIAPKVVAEVTPPAAVPEQPLPDVPVTEAKAEVKVEAATTDALPTPAVSNANPLVALIVANVKGQLASQKAMNAQMTERRKIDAAMDELLQNQFAATADSLTQFADILSQFGLESPVEMAQLAAEATPAAV